MSKKSARIAALIETFQGQQYSANYLGYFELFNRGQFYDAHDVLEELWLPVRQQPEGAFFKGLIQLAGAFVHLQKDRLRPATALLKLARTNLERYPALHHGLEMRMVLELIELWLQRLESGNFEANPLTVNAPPQLLLPN